MKYRGEEIKKIKVKGWKFLLGFIMNDIEKNGQKLCLATISLDIRKSKDGWTMSEKQKK